jgi:hypothetical protein
MRRVDGGFFASFPGGRTGRGAKLPPQLGHTPLRRVSTQSRQKVHSNVQIIALVADGGKSTSQHSQLGRSSSIQKAPLRTLRHTRSSRFRIQFNVMHLFGLGTAGGQ